MKKTKNILLTIISLFFFNIIFSVPTSITIKKENDSNPKENSITAVFLVTMTSKQVGQPITVPQGATNCYICSGPVVDNYNSISSIFAPDFKTLTGSITYVLSPPTASTTDPSVKYTRLTKK